MKSLHQIFRIIFVGFLLGSVLGIISTLSALSYYPSSAPAGGSYSIFGSHFSRFSNVLVSTTDTTDGKVKNTDLLGSRDEPTYQWRVKICPATNPIKRIIHDGTVDCSESLFSWTTGSYGSCVPNNGVCGTGTSTRPVTCVDEDGAPSSDSNCIAAQRPSPTQSCSVSCGCVAGSRTISGRTYSYPALSNGQSSTQSNTQVIANGSITYTVTFTCSNTSVSNGSESQTQACSSGYAWDAPSRTCKLIPGCGSANGTSVSSLPSGTAACSAGAQSVTDSLALDGTYNWNCDTLACSANKLPPAPTCTDGLQNGLETGIDCGGTCPNACIVNACAIEVSAGGGPTELFMAGDAAFEEFRTNYSNPYMRWVTGEAPGSRRMKYGSNIGEWGYFVSTPTYTTSRSGNIPGCNFTPPNPQNATSCTDGIQNGTETGIDCGGTCPNACDLGETGIWQTAPITDYNFLGNRLAGDCSSMAVSPGYTILVGYHYCYRVAGPSPTQFMWWKITSTNIPKGQCGTAATLPQAITPTTNLCANGSPGGVIESDSYYYWICGTRGGEPIECSANKTSAPPPSGNPPPTPLGLSGNPGNGSASLTWNASASATRYILQYTQNGHNNWTSVSTVNTSMNVTGLANGILYNFRVIASNSFGDSSPSVAISLMPVAPCITPWGTTIGHGLSVIAYAQSTSPNCSGNSETRTCNNGTLSGTFPYGTCSPPSCTSAPSALQGGSCAGLALQGLNPTGRTVGLAFYQIETASCMPNAGQIIPSSVDLSSCTSYTYNWVQTGWGSCSAACGGGAQSAIYVCQRSDGTIVSDSTCPTPKPNIAQSCNTEACACVPSSYTAWSACSASCGGGSQTRTDNCGTVYSQSCNPQACIVPVDASCGGSPNSCAAGIPSSYNAGSCGGSATWTCNGSNGGRNENCAVQNPACPVNGSCGGSANTCISGSPTGYFAGSCGGYQTWSCIGSNGGSSDSCNIANAGCPIVPSCGFTANSCASGTPSGYSAGSCGGSTTWSCNGANGGGSIACSIPNPACPVNGSCGGSPNSCASGTPSGYSAGSCGGSQTWMCNGANGGGTANCSTPNPACPVSGSCGGSPNTCASGTPSGYSAGSCGGSATWSCNGANGGGTANCSTPNPACVCNSAPSSPISIPCSTLAANGQIAANLTVGMGSFQIETATCSPNYNQTISVNSASCSAPPAYTYSWSIGSWSACSATCGGGSQSRTVTCMRNDGITVSDSFCGAKPATSQSCNTQACLPPTSSGCFGPIDPSSELTVSDCQISVNGFLSAGYTIGIAGTEGGVCGGGRIIDSSCGDRTYSIQNCSNSYCSVAPTKLNSISFWWVSSRNTSTCCARGYSDSPGRGGFLEYRCIGIDGRITTESSVYTPIDYDSEPGGLSRWSDGSCTPD